jgi:hypothetical protein
VIHELFDEYEDVRSEALIDVKNEWRYCTVSRSWLRKKGGKHKAYDSILLFREYLCFQLVVGFVVLKNIGGFSSYRVFR